MLSYATPLRGSTTPRIFTPPLTVGASGPCGCGCALTPQTSLGFSAVDFAEQVIGIKLLPWQRWLLIHAFELRPGSKQRFRYRTILILVARQNGKTSLVEVKNLWKMFVLQVRLVLGTAQNLDISEESWDKAVEIIEGVPELAVELTTVNKVNGKKFFRLANGSRWKVAAASRKGGRGLSGDDVNLDELREHHVWDSWAAVTKTTMARPDAQVFAFSNAGDDRSIVLNDLQAKGRAVAAQLVELLAASVIAEAEALTRSAAEQGIDTSLGLFEWSVPDDVCCTCTRDEGEPHRRECQLADRTLWAMANPSLGFTVTEEALASALSTDPEAIFRTECLCQRVPDLAGDWQVVAEESWNAQALPADSRERPTEVAFAVQVNHRRTHATIAAVGPRADGRLQAVIVDRRSGTHWVAQRLAELKDKWDPIAVAAQDKGPTGSLFIDFDRVGLAVPEDRDQPKRGDLAVPWAADVAVAYGMTVDALAQRRLVHLGEELLTAAVKKAKARPLGGGTAWAFDTDSADVLLAVTFALWAYVTREYLTSNITNAWDHVH